MKKIGLFTLSILSLLSCTLMTSCSNDNGLSKSKPQYQLEDHTSNFVDDTIRNYYQVLVYSYYDSNKDGIGDLKGLTSKLDYINDGNKNSSTSLGYSGLYLLPIFPSPTYHKYDSTDYYNVDSSYGTLDDFDNLIAEANKRGIDVILDLAINHTSDQHPWFIKACRDIAKVTDYDENGEPTEASKELYSSIRYYNFKKQSYASRGNYHPVSGTDWVYEGQFNSGMPDLNLHDKVVQDEVKNIMKFWLDRGVAGFRLDAVEHYDDQNKSFNYEMLNKIASFGKELTKGRSKGCFLVAEGPWSESVTSYYANTNDISYMNFVYGTGGGAAKLQNTIVNTALYNKKINELNKKKIEIIYNTPKDENANKFNIVNDNADVRCAADYFKNIVTRWDEKLYQANENAVDANFGVNHDTVRAINAIYGSFDDKNLANGCKYYWGMNNTLSGNTFNYYGEEIGMRAGSQSVEQNKDPNKRHPMYWSKTSKEGMTNYAPGATEVEQLLDPADKQMKDSDSLWNFMREINRAKSFFPEIARGKQKFVKVEPTYAVLQKTYNGNTINLIYNFSDKVNKIKLNNLGLEEEPNQILYSLSSSSSYYAKLTAETINVPAYSITII